MGCTSEQAEIPKAWTVPSSYPPGAMKKIQRFVFGLVTSLLLSVGLVRAAELSAPANQSKVVAVGDHFAPNCEMPCAACSTSCNLL